MWLNILYIGRSVCEPAPAAAGQIWGQELHAHLLHRQELARPATHRLPSLRPLREPPQPPFVQRHPRRDQPRGRLAFKENPEGYRRQSWEMESGRKCHWFVARRLCQSGWPLRSFTSRSMRSRRSVRPESDYRHFNESLATGFLFLRPKHIMSGTKDLLWS